MEESAEKAHDKAAGEGYGGIGVEVRGRAVDDAPLG
jgi:hypothetical protein